MRTIGGTDRTNARLEDLRLRLAFGQWRAQIENHLPFVVACGLLLLLLAVYGSLRRNVFTLEELNLDSGAAMTLVLAATGQTIVLLRGGIDLSLGGMISLGTVLAATHFGEGSKTFLWSFLIVIIGLIVGLINGLLTTVLKLQPFLVTLATWSILSGTALTILPTDGGNFPTAWMELGSASFAGLSSSTWLLIGVLLFWAWFSKTRVFIAIRATGSNERSAYLSGVSILRVDLTAYGLSGMFAALASLYLTTLTGTGSPTVGKDYILPSVAAAVIGGVSLFGGRGGLPGTIAGAFIITVVSNLVFTLSISTYWQSIISGLILLTAVLAGSLAEKSVKRSLG